MYDRNRVTVFSRSVMQKVTRNNGIQMRLY